LSSSWNCANSPPVADTGLGAPGTTTSHLQCIDVTSLGQPIQGGAGTAIAHETFNLSVGSDDEVVLTLSNVSVSDQDVYPLINCDPTREPPAVPDPAGPCLTATLHFFQ